MTDFRTTDLIAPKYPTWHDRALGFAMDVQASDEVRRAAIRVLVEAGSPTLAQISDPIGLDMVACENCAVAMARGSTRLLTAEELATLDMPAPLRANRTPPRRSLAQGFERANRPALRRDWLQDQRHWLRWIAVGFAALVLVMLARAALALTLGLPDVLAHAAAMGGM